MRCTDCNKFVSFDDSNEPEVQDVNVDDNGYITAEVRFVLTCAECGAELKEGNYSLDGNVDLSSHDTSPKEDKDPMDVHSLEAEEDSCSMETVSTKSKTNYQVSLSVKVTCTACDFEETVELSGEMTSGEMDELV